MQEEDWWTGKIGDRTGVFPFNYVEVASEVAASNVQEVFDTFKILCKMFVLDEWRVDVFLFCFSFHDFHFQYRRDSYIIRIYSTQIPCNKTVLINFLPAVQCEHKTNNVFINHRVIKH